MTYEASDLLLQCLRRCEGYGELGMWQQTWQELEDLPDEERSRLPVLIWRVKALVGLGFLKNAVGLGRTLLRTYPESMGVRNVLCDALIALAVADMRGGDRVGAEQCVEECLELEPQRREEVFKLGMMN